MSKLPSGENLEFDPDEFPLENKPEIDRLVDHEILRRAHNWKC